LWEGGVLLDENQQPEEQDKFQLIALPSGAGVALSVLGMCKNVNGWVLESV
jgi:hypothetical protein